MQAARYFPEIEGNRLVPPPGSKETEVHTSELLKGKISLVAMLSTRISEVGPYNAATMTQKRLH